MAMQTVSESRVATFKAGELAERTLERHAIEAAIWGMPIVSVDAMRRAFLSDARAGYNDIVYFSKPADWQLQLTTPNAAAYYAYLQINTKSGPLVLEVPSAEGAGLFGSVNDAWQSPRVDVGPTGADEGKGGKYLLLPPGYVQPVPPGYLPVRLDTYNGYSLLRAVSITDSGADVARALELVKRLRLYPLAQASNPPPQRHVDMARKLFDGITRFDLSFYESLARMVNEEPVQTRDFVAMAQLRSIGIEKGRPFRPDPAMQVILARAIAEAHAILMHSVADGTPFWHGQHWILPGEGIGAKTAFAFETGESLEYEERGTLFFLACAPPRKPGAASFYVWSMRDANGHPLHGGKTYRLRIPAHVPARQFWAVTVYDLETAGFFRGAPRLELNSYDQKAQRNPDGSVDVYFGPTNPTGKEANWILTVPGKSWFAAFRFYGPERQLMERTWVLEDIKRVTPDV